MGNETSPSLLVGVRKRPGMYVGDPRDGSGLHHMLWEVVVNALDVYLRGEASELVVELDGDELVVRDDGPGFSSFETFEDAFLRGHLTPTADGHAPHIHMTPQGVGVFVVTALSGEGGVSVDTSVDGERFAQTFYSSETSSERRPSEHAVGTHIRFVPDWEVFTTRWEPTRIVSRLREVAAIFPSLRIFWNREQIPTPRLVDLLTKPPTEGLEASLQLDLTKIRLEFGFRSGGGSSRGFTNLLPNTDGSHLQGLCDGVEQALQAEFDLSNEELGNLAWRESLGCVVSVSLIDPKFGAPTTQRLINPELRKPIRDAAERILRERLQSDAAYRAWLGELLGVAESPS